MIKVECTRLHIQTLWKIFMSLNQSPAHKQHRWDSHYRLYCDYILTVYKTTRLHWYWSRQFVFHQTFILKWRLIIGFASWESENKVFWKVSRENNLKALCALGISGREISWTIIVIFVHFFFFLWRAQQWDSLITQFSKMLLNIKTSQQFSKPFLKCACSLRNATNSVETKLTLGSNLNWTWEMFRMRCVPSLFSLPHFLLLLLYFLSCVTLLRWRRCHSIISSEVANDAKSLSGCRAHLRCPGRLWMFALKSACRWAAWFRRQRQAKVQNEGFIKVTK